MTLTSKSGIVVPILISVGASIVYYFYNRFRPKHNQNKNQRNDLRESELLTLKCSASNVHVIEHEEEWEQMYPHIVSQTSEMRVLGFDCEWVTVDRQRQPISLLQLATPVGTSVLVRMQYLEKVPTTLQQLLSDRSIMKVGVGCLEDGVKLRRDYGLNVRGCLDLRNLAARLGKLNQGRAGLQSIAQDLLGLTLDKDVFLRCSNWEDKYLSSEQIAYAAKDALVGLDIFLHLLQCKLSTNRKGQSTETYSSSICQGLVDVKYHDLGGSTKRNRLQERHKSKNGNSGKEAKYTRTTTLYHNCQIHSPNGKLLWKTSKIKAEWYLKKDLGFKVSDDPLTVQLKFEPDHRPPAEGDYTLHDKHDLCVICGATQSLLKFNIIPKDYRRNFPKEFQQRNTHDVALVCTDCHRETVRPWQELKERLAQMCGAPGPSEVSLKDQNKQQVKGAANTLLKSYNKLPEVRRIELEKIIMDFCGVEMVDNNLLQDMIALDVRKKESIHGLGVVEYFETNSSVRELERMWRQHFLDALQPRFLPEGWSVDHICKWPATQQDALHKDADQMHSLGQGQGHDTQLDLTDPEIDGSNSHSDNDDEMAQDSHDFYDVIPKHSDEGHDIVSQQNCDDIMDEEVNHILGTVSQQNIRSPLPSTSQSQIYNNHKPQALLTETCDSSQIYVIERECDWDAMYREVEAAVSAVKVVGMDCEWVSGDSSPRPVSLLQLATTSAITLLVRMHMLNTLPQSLAKLLADKSILKVGVGCIEDGNKLHKDYGLYVRGCVDLRNLAERTGNLKLGRTSLKHLAEDMLGLQMNKSVRLRCSNWESEELSEQQIMYAAKDAFVALDIFSALLNDKMQGSVYGAVSAQQWSKVLALCQGLKDIKHRQSNESKPTEKPHTKNNTLQEYSDRKTRKKKYAESVGSRTFYHNCEIRAPDGQLLCKTSRVKAQWYLKKDLGVQISDNPLVIRMKFEPARRPPTDSDYFLQDKETLCVVCGQTQHLNRKYIVPIEYRKYFPKEIKEHKIHDVVLMCSDCHYACRFHDTAFKEKLAEECGAPAPSDSDTMDRNKQKVKGAAKALLKNTCKLPESRRKELEEILTQYYGAQKINEQLLLEAANMDVRITESLHGRHVVRYYEEHRGLETLERSWRQHFLDVMEPKFLSKSWSVDHTSRWPAVSQTEAVL